MRKPTAKQQASADRKSLRFSCRVLCAGIQIDVLDIGKVFAAGRAAAANDDDIENAVVRFAETIRRN